MEDLRHLEFFANNSKEVVEKQVDSYRQQHSYAGTIIGVTALFIPFFLNSFVGTFQVIQFISIIPIVLFIWAILLMLSIFRTNPLDQAYNVKKYGELLTKTYKEILTEEIEANLFSYNENKVITNQGNKNYTSGVRLTTIALLISIVLLFVNQFIKIEKIPIKDQTPVTRKEVRKSPAFGTFYFRIDFPADSPGSPVENGRIFYS